MGREKRQNEEILFESLSKKKEVVQVLVEFYVTLEQ